MERRRATLVDDISGRTGITDAMIATLVDTFHGRVRQDPLPASVLAKVDDWDGDLAKPRAFWSSADVGPLPRPADAGPLPDRATAREIRFNPVKEHDMKHELKAHPIVDGIIDVFGDWLMHRREVREMRRLDAGTLDGIARDLRMTSGDLDTFVRQGPHAADELPKLLKVLGIDEAVLARSETAVLRDMERVCILCVRKAQCNNDLELGVSARDYQDYCLNAPTMKALSQNQVTGIKR